LAAAGLAAIPTFLPSSNPADSPIRVAIDAGNGILIAGRADPVKISFTNDSKERVKLDASCMTGLGLRIKPVNGPVPDFTGDAGAASKEPPFEIPPGGTLTCTVDASGVASMLAGKVDSAELWFEMPALKLKSAPVPVELIEDLSKVNVVFETNKGIMKFKVDLDHAPLAARNFVRHAQNGNYTGTYFHRILKGFMAQGGDPNTKDTDPANDGGGGAPFNGKILPSEIGELKHSRGTLSMARNGDPMAQYAAQMRQMLQQLYSKNSNDPKYVQEQLMKLDKEGFFKDRKPFLDSAGSQFFICFGPTPQLDGGYTAFGQMVDGDETLKKIEAVAAASDQDNQGRPKERVTLTKAWVEAAK
jgi:peptidyl-prolyl cis-trans isomerase B (cyclophilin B)